MKSVYNFVVTPHGERYNNTKDVDGSELILNTEIYSHQFVNRLAKVISVPIIGQTDIKPGDIVVVHHNVFRRWNDVRGRDPLGAHDKKTAHGAVATHHYENLFKNLGDKEKQLISESSELENEYKSEVSSINTKKN